MEKLYASGLALIGVFVCSGAVAQCVSGDSRCGTDSYVERCNAGGDWDSSMVTCKIEGRRNRSSGGSCTPGDSRCGADGHAEQCNRNGDWDTTLLECTR